MAEQSPAPDAGADGADEDLQVVGLDSADAGAVLDAVSSDTARTVLSALQEEPGPASAVADRTGLALQTVQYHLDNLRTAGLVEVVDSRTSEKGREMDVYGPAADPVVVVAGEDDDGLRSSIAELLSAVGLLAVASLLVQEVFGDGVGALLGGPGGAEVQTAAADGAGGVGGAAAGVEPGLLFFAGGLAVLLAWTALQVVQRR